MLEIEFKDGSIYRYKGVKKKVFKGLLSSESKGKHFHQNIKTKYPYKKYQAEDGSKTGDEYHMKTAQIRNYNEFCKTAGRVVFKNGQIIDHDFEGNNYARFKEYKVEPSRPIKQGGGWEPAKPLSKKQKAAMGALLGVDAALGIAYAAHKISEKRKLKKKKQELQDAGWIKE